MKTQNRHKARFLALQALYQWQMAADVIENIRGQFLDKINPKKVDVDYFEDLLKGVIDNVGIIDNAITPFLDRKLDDLDMVELAVIRLATYELMKRSDVPYKVVINEALELAKDFGSIDGFKYVNGVLDRAARLLRPEERGGQVSA